MKFLENKAIVDGLGNCLMPATPMFQKHGFFKKCPKNLTNFGKFQFFLLHFLLQFYRAFQWYIVCFHTLSDLGCIDQNVNQEIKGCISFFRRLYIKATIGQCVYSMNVSLSNNQSITLFTGICSKLHVCISIKTMPLLVLFLMDEI